MLSPAERQTKIDRIRRFPAELTALVADLSEEQLTTHYLPDEWTVCQNIHHMPDAHMNSYIRLRLILTEENPPLKPYDQDRWAELPDSNRLPIENSLQILRGLHARWCDLFASLTDDQRQRTGYHPDLDKMLTPDHLLDIYANHCDAHIDQINKTLAAQS